jgi:type VI secretion system secreted protein Hcp
VAFDCFLKIDGIPGESTDDKHKDWIEVLSFSWNVARGKRGRAQIADFSVIKKLDKATPVLFDAICAGEHIPEANFAARRAGSQNEFLTFKLSQVFISGVAPAGNTTNDFPMEQVSFSFGKIEISYQPQLPDGRMGPPVTSTCGGRASSLAAEPEQ